MARWYTMWSTITFKDNVHHYCQHLNGSGENFLVFHNSDSRPEAPFEWEVVGGIPQSYIVTKNATLNIKKVADDNAVATYFITNENGAGLYIDMNDDEVALVVVGKDATFAVKKYPCTDAMRTLMSFGSHCTPDLVKMFHEDVKFIKF